MRVRSVLPHLPFSGVLAVAVWIRVVAVLGYPAPLWFGDSPGYLEAAVRLRPDETRPSGYPILLWLIKPFHSFTVMVSVQHVIGILTGVLVYVLVWRAGRVLRPWIAGVVAALLTVPVLIPVHQVALEHMLMSDSLFAFLLLAAVAAVLWRRRTTWWLAALAGVFAAAAALTRTAGLPLIALILVAMLIRKAGWRACAATAVAFVLPVVGYMFWFHAEYGEYKFAKADQVFLYGRTAAFADCRVIKPRPELAVMCPRQSDPRISKSFSVMWTPDSPFRDIPGWVYGDQGNRLAGEFAWAAIKAQPVDYGQVVVEDTLKAFTWHRQPYPTPWTWLQYDFPQGEAWSDKQAKAARQYGDDGETRVVRPWAGQVLAYQDHVVMPGTILGVLLLGGLAGAFVHVRPGHWLRRPVRHWATGALLPWGTSLALLVIPAATADFDYRYVLPAVPFACVALGLALIPPPRPPEEAPKAQDEPAPREEVSA
ncbi:hypothetical protein E1293_17435 [Actinomadura darangshiensis]|uniref:Glycosyltransferase RgtA/B/C/D-like domain-containing protein n=1 Tax=Actinomadura darangshiensis TaxID=705336 RepID=A0A4R5BA71_9ACTN|nr:hypothetical protein [Actinomadura darangshiensis]TDD81999.1 hypothetical protein E1293_17435 [Actinomadura darangshiensis]